MALDNEAFRKLMVITSMSMERMDKHQRKVYLQGIRELRRRQDFVYPLGRVFEKPIESAETKDVAAALATPITPLIIPSGVNLGGLK